MFCVQLAYFSTRDIIMTLLRLFRVILQRKGGERNGFFFSLVFFKTLSGVLAGLIVAWVTSRNDDK